MSQNPATGPHPQAQDSLKGFWALIAAQFQAAFNDNAYKNLLTVLAVYEAATPEKGKAMASTVSTVFILPFLFFSMYGGHFADRYSKRSVAIITKLAEVGIMLLGAVAFFSHHFFISLIVLGGMGVHSAFFGPAKYGIIPELIPEKRISWANGILELSTFVAIISGTWAGGYLCGQFKGQLQYAMLILAVLSIVGAIIALSITKVPAAAPDKPLKLNFFVDLWRYIRYSMKDRVLWLAVQGNTYFWFIAGVIYLNIASFAPEVLHLTEKQMGMVLVSLSLGIGFGSFAAGYLSSGKIEYGFVPLGALIMAIFALDMFRPNPSLTHSLVSLAVVGFGGGFFIVPVQALVQHRPSAENKGGVQGMAYFLSNAGLLAASGVYFILTVLLHLSPSQVFLVCSLLTFVVTAYIIWLTPDSIVRLALWFAGHSIYRIRIVGRDNIPEHGGALFACNHVSFADVLFIVASTDRHVRFIMDEGWYNTWWLRPFAKIMHAIPMSAESGPDGLSPAFDTARRAIENGDVVCIFPEGAITRTGKTEPFRKEFEGIMNGLSAPIIPIHLGGVWGSIFSYEQGRFVWKWPRRIPYPVTVSYGTPMPVTATAEEIQNAVKSLAGS